MKNKINENIEELFENWLDFREERLETLTEEDKEHKRNTDVNVENIIKNIPEENIEYVLEQLHIISDKLVDYSTYYNKKYYKAGFQDCFSIIMKNMN